MEKPPSKRIPARVVAAGPGSLEQSVQEARFKTKWRKAQSHKPESAFTLVEMLVVIGIMLLLAGLLMPSLIGTKEGQKAKNAIAELEYLKVVIGQYRDEFGDYPPSDVGLAANVPNKGNKALVACLATSLSKESYLRSYMMRNEEKTRVTNTLAANDLQWRFTDRPRNYRELLDPWGSPYIYLHNRDYRSADGQVYTVQGRASGGKFELPCTVKARKDANGVYRGQSSFQLWSCGPNRTNDNGLEDDITSWVK